MRYIALLRAINVGGRNRLSMGDLKGLLSAGGYSDVTTYLQSGNALFTGPDGDRDELAREIEARMLRDLSLDITVFIRTRDDLAAAIDGNPFPDATSSPSRLFITFLSASPDPVRASEVDMRPFEPDQFRVANRVIYLWCPDGAARSKLTNEFWERRFGLKATTRNWTTVNKLASMAGE